MKGAATRRGIVSTAALAGVPQPIRHARAQTASDQEGRSVRIRIRFEGAALTATLDNNATARDFASLLPVTLTLRDYANTEKVSDFPRRLSTESAPAGIDPSVGDIAYYAPWGNLAIFYRDFGYSRGLIRLGRIDGNVAALVRPEPFRATIEFSEGSGTRSS